MMKYGYKVTISALVLLLLGAGIAVPQTAPLAQKGVPVTKGVEPDRSTFNYGDWALNCVRVGSTAVRQCEVAQALVSQGQTQPVARVAIGSLDKPDALRFTLQIAPAIALTDPPQLRLNGKAGPPAMTLTWRRCLPAGCFADNPISADVLKQLREPREQLEITLRDAVDQEATLTISLKGLPGALDALAKELTAPK